MNESDFILTIEVSRRLTPLLRVHSVLTFSLHILTALKSQSGKKLEVSSVSKAELESQPTVPSLSSCAHAHVCS